ncbi:ubiquitin carboxyl-terminal hydrolase 16 [Genypterus blacodes]|uniref:ubiquitin carboxyl-terminal hydrolase 16 n=1 Tax=Genypterus blacodes TaxID=154954 RepID=UPI003F76B24C
MGKKRGKDRSIREEDDIDLTGPSCRHIKKAVDPGFLKKLSASPDWSSCQDCKTEEHKENNSPNVPQDCEEEKEPPALWMCLKCGHRGCGRNSENQHAIRHYEVPRSEPHCLVVSMDSWNVWCYICDDDVQYSSTGQLAQLVTSLKKQSASEPVKKPQRRAKEEESSSKDGQQPEPAEAAAPEITTSEQSKDKENKEHKENKENKDQQKKGGKKESVLKSKSSGASEGGSVVSVKGLSNLGNTCFFNAVIQNLSQTQLLRQTLNTVTEERTSLDIKPGTSTDLEPIVVQLEHPGSLTLSMCHLLNEILGAKKGVVNPRELFTQVCKKAARFKGFQQQDSQELLRYLLDGMRAEEIKRVNAGILDALKRSGRSGNAEETKTLIKEYEKNGAPRNFVDHVFGGEMTSTVMCQLCKTVSVVTEMFLDLSLPVSDEAYRKKPQKKAFQKSSDPSQEGRNSPALTNGGEDVAPSGTGSKYQQKKAKKQAKKQAKHQRRQQKLDGRVTLDSLTSETDPDAEDGQQGGEAAENGKEPQEEPSSSQSNPEGASEQDGDTAHTAKEEEEEEEDEEEEEEDSVMDCDSPACNRFTALSEERQAKDGEVEDEEMTHEIEKISLNDACLDDSDATEEVTVSESQPPPPPPPEDKEYTVVNQDPELAFHTLAPRAAPEKLQCSVQSCLFQFTEVETLTQNNSLQCVTCTRRHPDRAAGAKKSVYTDALKQMLISSAPPVLTLHLKRFQQSGYSICKVNRHVQFPLILDLAPFCAAQCKNVTEGESQVLYSLYGIVEHSGTMRSGHYTAYVKARPHCPAASSNGLKAEGGAEPPRGSWFHISDTSVQPVPESKAQSSQAYLLFYERIL